MSANEIELTFIRCPSCKSLMPSTAVKCGMCGFDLGSGDEDTSTRELQRKSRLRQKTFYGDASSEVNEEADSDVFRDTGKGKGYLNPHSDLLMKSGVDFDHSDFEDSEAETGMSDSAARVPEPVEKKVEEKEIGRTSFNESRSRLHFSGDRKVVSSEEDEEMDEDQETSESEVLQENSSEIRKKRKRKRKKKKPVIQDMASEEASEERESSVKRVTPLQRASSQEGYHDLSGKNVSHPREEVQGDLVKQRPEVQEPESAPDNFGRKHNLPKHDISSEVVRQESQISGFSQVKKQGLSKGEGAMLIGWFVNYTNDKQGLSFEIRMGRQFIGRQSLREDDLIIQDSAISTPHCLLQVEGNGTVLLQDLMSEHGTFVKKAGNGDYQQIDSSVSLAHGDKVRLGSFEMVVCLIPR